MARGSAESFDVWLHDRNVGHLHFQEGLTTFEFRDDYRGMADRPVLGQMFEQDPRRRWRQAQRVPVWFSNLLPEDGPLLDFLAEELDVSPRSEMRLLAALGRDLPGAVAVTRSGSTPPALNGGEIEDPPQDEDTGIRFSVAGVQLKLSMVRDGNTLRLAGRDERGSFYVKFAGSFSAVPENEFAMMRAAALSGISVPEIDLVDGSELSELPSSFSRYSKSRVFVVRRFDRSSDGAVHIEDMSQVSGTWPEKKYKSVSYEGLGRVLRALCGDDDFLEYLRRVAFCVLIGNEDAHLKNWSLLYPDRRRPRLAPAYDLVSTIQYDDLDRGLALPLGGSHNPEAVTLDSFAALADAAGYEGQEEPVETVRRLVQQYRERVGDVRSESPLGSGFWSRLETYQTSLPFASDK